MDGRTGTWDRALAAVVVLAVAALEVRRLALAPLEYVLWSDRDLVRASRFWTELPTTGAELSFLEDARVPGSFLYLLWSLPLALSPTPEAVWRTGVALEALGLALLGAVVARRAGAWSGALAASVTASATASAETMLRLWNPAFLALFTAGQVALALALADGAGPLAWLALGLVTSLGAQLHAVALLFGTVVALASLPGARGRAVGLASFVAGLLVGLAPYLVVEAASGWPNTTAILAGPPHGGPVDRDVGRLLAGLAHQLAVGTAYTAHGLAWTSVLHVGTVVGLATALRVRDPQARGLLPLVAGALAIPALHAVGGRVDLLAGWDGRYVLPATAVAGVLAGVGWARLRATRLGAAALLVATVAAVAAPLGVASILPRSGVDTLAFQRRALAAVRAETGWTLAEVAGRTSLWRVAGPHRFTSRAENGIAWLLRGAGEAFPGSLPSPCAVVIAGGARATDDLTADDLRATLAQDLGPLRILRQRAIDDDRFVLYEVGGPCPTTLTDRYVELPEEAVIRAHWKAVPFEAAVEVPGPAGVHRFVARHLPPRGGLGLGFAVDLVPAPGRVDVALHANQLRGRGYNPGLLSMAMLGHPRVVLTSADRRLEVPLAVDLVGDRGVLTPLHAGATVPAGTYAAAFEAEDVDHPGDAWPADLDRTPFRVALTDTLVVP